MPSSSSSRVRGASATFTLEESSTEGLSTVQTTNFNGTYPEEAVSRSWNNTPGYRDLVKERRPIPPQAFYFDKKTNVSSSFMLTSKTPKIRENAWEGLVHTTETYRGDIAAFGQLSAASIDQSNYKHHVTISDDEVFIKLRDGLNGGESWNSLVFGAEGASSARMISSNAVKLLDAVRFAKRGNIKGLRGIFGVAPPGYRKPKPVGRTMDSASSLWLEYTYGWKPLVSDIGTAVVALDGLISRRSNPQGNRRLRSTIRRESNVSEQVYFSGSPHTIIADRHQQKQEWRRGTLNWRISSHELYNAKSFGFTNPLEVAYELMFLSFVVDWVVPIGDYLSSLDNHLGVEIVGDWSVSTKIVNCWKYSNLRDPAGLLSGGFDGVGPRSTTTFVCREIHSGSVPLPSLDFLKVRPQLGASRLTSAIALTKQLLFKTK